MSEGQGAANEVGGGSPEYFTDAARTIAGLSPRWWECLRIGPVSGRYEGVSSAFGREFLDLRVDIDPCYANSPVMNRISGDFYREYDAPWITPLPVPLPRQRIPEPPVPEFPSTGAGADKSILPGRFPGFRWRVYKESWIVDKPVIKWSKCSVEITGRVRFWKGLHPTTSLRIIIPWASLTSIGPADVTFTESGGSTSRYNCTKISNCLRDLTLEMDVTKSFNREPILPNYDTDKHTIRPVDLPRRTLTIERAYRESGVCLSLNAARTIIDDTTADFVSWSDAELHDVMETNFSEFEDGWPKWYIWGLLCGRHDDTFYAGIMFDYIKKDLAHRQGFAIFRKHWWFDNLVSGTPTNEDQAWAMRQLLYTYVHEAGHAFNLMHSWDKDRPDSLSWMNYPHNFPFGPDDPRNDEDQYWRNFRFRFDDEELIHIRHGDRASVIMGADPWSSGGHLEEPPNAMSLLEGQPPVELLIRSQGYFEYMEPVEIEFRLRNLSTTAITLDTSLQPGRGPVRVFIKGPDGRILEYMPIIYKEGSSVFSTLQPTNGKVSGEDRYSESVFLSYGKRGWIFEQSGEYEVKAVYDGLGSIIPSNTLHLRIGTPESKEEDRLAHDFFSYQVGMMLYLNGSQSPFLKEGKNLLELIVNKYHNTLLGAKVATVLATSEARNFFRIKNMNNPVLEKTHAADPKKALDLTTPARDVYRRKNQKDLNILYHELIRDRVKYLLKTNAKTEAKNELSELRKDLANRQVKENVLKNIKQYEESLE
jgi:hypothetical protein